MMQLEVFLLVGFDQMWRNDGGFLAARGRDAMQQSQETTYKQLQMCERGMCSVFLLRTMLLALFLLVVVVVEHRAPYLDNNPLSMAAHTRGGSNGSDARLRSTSGAIPFLLISIPLGVWYLATVTATALPSDSGTIV